MKIVTYVLLVGVGAVIGSATTALISARRAATPVTASPATQATAKDDLDPVKVAPTTHRLLFENQWVKVIEARIPAGVHDAKHAHNKGVLVFLDDYDMQMKYYPKGDTKTVHRVAKTAVWSDALVHETINVGTATSHAIRIELKDPPPQP